MLFFVGYFRDFNRALAGRVVIGFGTVWISVTIALITVVLGELSPIRLIIHTITSY